jgi:signal transduction histidine kinase
MLDHVCFANPAFANIVVYDAAWRALASVGERGYTENRQTPREFRRDLEQTADVVFAPPSVTAGKRIEIHVGAPVRGTSGEPIGFVVASVLLSDTLYPILEDHGGLRTSTKTYIVSPDGQFLSGPRRHSQVLSRGTGFPPGFLAGSLARAANDQDCCGNQVLAMSTPMPELGWVLVAEVDREEAFAWLMTLRRRAFTAGLVVLVGVLLLGLAGAARVARPFHQLRDVASRVAAGDHARRIARLDCTEAQEVASAFNAMLDELAAYAEKLANAGALAAVGQLSSSIVHEMRNPLASIKLNLSAVREVFADGSEDRELADIALQEASRVEGMLNDLLAYGRPLELQAQPTPLAHLLQRSLDHARAACRERNVRVVVDCQGHENDALAIDEEQALRALGNLIDNALAFSPEQGVLTLSVAIPSDRSHVLEIAVRDQGPGVQAEHMEQVFDPFFTTRERGTGLGLANVRKIVECHGGSVRAENHPDGGAVFTIRLPMDKPNRE